MLGYWPEADTARTGFAAASYLVYAVAIRAWRPSMLGVWPEAPFRPTGGAGSSYPVAIRARTRRVR